MKSRLFCRVTFVSLLLFLAGAIQVRTNTATLEVDPDGGTPYPTIQSAIDVAVPGTDDVFVRCGVYYEHIVMRDAVRVQGQSPNCAIIDGQQSGVVVTMDGLGPQKVLTGFTIRNGAAVSVPFRL